MTITAFKILGFYWLAIPTQLLNSFENPFYIYVFFCVSKL